MRCAAALRTKTGVAGTAIGRGALRHGSLFEQNEERPLTMQVTEDGVSETRKPARQPDKSAEDRSEDRSSGSLIDANLRRVYDDLVEDDVPDRFKTLLEQLRRQEQEK